MRIDDFKLRNSKPDDEAGEHQHNWIYVSRETEFLTINPGDNKLHEKVTNAILLCKPCGKVARTKIEEKDE